MEINRARRAAQRDPAGDGPKKDDAWRPKHTTPLASMYEQWVGNIGAKELAQVMTEKKRAEKPLLIPMVEELRKGDAEAHR